MNKFLEAFNVATKITLGLLWGTSLVIILGKLLLADVILGSILSILVIFLSIFLLVLNLKLKEEV
jgi:hypothetical protein